MKNELLNVSAATREQPLDMPGIVFLNDVVVIHQALDAVAILGYRASSALTTEVVHSWKAVLTQLMGTVIYSKQKNFGANHARWADNLTAVKRVSKSAASTVSKLSRLLDEAVKPLKLTPTSTLDKAAASEIAKQVRALESDLRFLAKAFPENTPLSDWTTFARNLSRDFAEERFPQLPWAELPASRSSSDGRQALPELYDRLFTDAVFPATLGFVGLKQEDFLRLEVRPTEIPEVAEALKQVRSNPAIFASFNASEFAATQYVVRATDASAAREYLLPNVIQPLIDRAKEIARKVNAEAEKMASALEKELTVSVTKARKLIEVLSAEELATLRRLLGKAVNTPSSTTTTAAKPAVKRSRAKRA